MIKVSIAAIPAGKRRDAERRAAAELVSRLFGAEASISHTPDGAPFITGIPDAPAISITHSGEWLMIAYAPGGTPPFGIDLERQSERVARVVPRVMTPAESHLDPLLCWTAKEATFKALGIPEAVLSDIEVSPDGRYACAHGQRFLLSHPDAPAGYLATIARIL